MATGKREMRITVLDNILAALVALLFFAIPTQADEIEPEPAPQAEPEPVPDVVSEEEEEFSEPT